MVTLSGFMESSGESPPCIKCKQKMVFSSMRNATEFEPMFDTGEVSDAQ